MFTPIFTVIKTSTTILVAALLGITTAKSAIAQVTIRSTGVVSGTVTPPNKNPNFNQGTTRVDTDSQGRYVRNGQLIFDASAVNPSLVGVDAAGRYYVDFRGIPVVSADGALTSPVLTGQLDATQRFNHNAPVRYWGNIQDEFVVQGNFTGTATNPATGEQYQGTFPIRGQGPRYSATNGGESPTVFDFKSYYNFKANPAINPTPTVFSYSIPAMPVQLTVTVPVGLAPIATGVPTGAPTGAPIGAIPNNPIGQSATTVFSNQSVAFELNHHLLDAARFNRRPIGPVSRILLR
jgi:hypothetical protein